MSYFGVSTRNGVGLGLGTVPSLTNTPLGYRLAPSLDLSFAGSDALSPAITFSRTTNATLTNSAGLVANAPMNLLTFSEQFDNAAWVKTAATVTANSTAAPDGTLTADTLIATAVSGAHFISSASFSSTLGPTYTLSLFAKAAGSTRFILKLANSVDIVAFDLSTATVTNSGSSTGTITSAGNGWFRCTVTSPAAITGSENYRLILLDSSGNITFTGDGVSGLFIWGAQLEARSTATTYNPTTVKNLLGFTENFDNDAWTKSNAFVQTNLLTYSQDFTNAAWVKDANRGSFATNAVSPIGDATAQTLTSGTDGYGYAFRTVAATVGVAYAYSIYAKAGTSNFAYIEMSGFGISYVNLTTLAISAAAGVTVTATSVGSGWVRIVGLATASATSHVIAFGGSNASGSQVMTSGNTVLFWGAQLVQGTSAGDYKATYAAAAAVGYTDIYGQPFAQKLVENTANNTHDVRFAASVSVTTPYCLSVYAKAAERSKIWIKFANGAPYVIFDLSAGTATAFAGATSSITAVGNGWYRCACISVPSIASDQFRILLDNGSSVSYTGDGTSGIYIFGAQLSDSASVDPYVYQPVAAPSSVAYYGPRFDYDPVTLQPKGLLIEEQRTNLLLNTSVLGTQVVTVTAVAHTLSFYGTGTIVLSGAATGTVVGTGAYPTRTTLTFTPIVGVLTVTVTGPVTSAQLEAGAFATSYISTVASQVTRAADNASIIGNNFARWYNATQGSTYVDFNTFATSSLNVVEFNAGQSVNSIALYREATTWRYRTALANLNLNSAQFVSNNKTAFVYAASDYVISVNGNPVQTNTGVGSIAPSTQLIIGGAASSFSYGANSSINGTIKRIAFYPRRLANSELQSITA